MRMKVGGGLAALVAATVATAAPAAAVSPEGFTTEERSVEAGGPVDPSRPRFRALQQGPGWARVVRELTPGQALAGRADRRRTLTYFAQLSDFQLADEESPARVEFSDPLASSAWRPQEALGPFTVDSVFRQVNRFTGASPVEQAGGTRAPMDFALTTGDNADSQQHNETVWVRQLIEGGQPLDPNSGVRSSYLGCGPVAAAALRLRELLGQLPDEPAYTGVADYRDHPFNTTAFYDPNQPAGQFGDWPRYGGLLDRAQQPFTPVGLRRGGAPVPTYLSNGNHDGLVQGNEDAILPLELISTGCLKPFVPVGQLPPGGDPIGALLNATGFLVRPDPARRYVDKPQMKAIYAAGAQRDGHGYGLVDPAQNAASRNAASYYAWDPRPGVRFVSIDTVSEGGIVALSSEGNLDDPQYQWLQGEIAAARAARKLVVVFGHHPVRSLVSDVPDELALPCTVRDGHGHDANPGCDLDPRVSLPIRKGPDVQALFNANANVIAYVSGHTHENKVLACAADAGCPAGANWWEINTASEIDWPQQSRLLEVMDNGDDTLSIFGTVLDTAAPYAVPPAGSAAAFDTSQLAALSRSFSFNDPQAVVGANGLATDRNVELLVADPR